MIRLKPEIIVELKKNSRLRLKVQGAITASHNTMMKYLDDNDVRLTALDSIDILVDELQLPLAEIVQGSLNNFDHEPIS